MIKNEYPKYYQSHCNIPEIVSSLVAAGEVNEPALLFMKFMREEHFSMLPSLVNPSDVIKLKEIGEVNFLTNIIEDGVPQRRKNLDDLGINFGEIFLGGLEQYGNPNYPRKSDIIKNQTTPDDIIIFLDDLSENYDDVISGVPHSFPFVMRSFENQFSVLDGYKVIKYFKDFPNEILSLIGNK